MRFKLREQLITLLLQASAPVKRGSSWNPKHKYQDRATKMPAEDYKGTSAILLSGFSVRSLMAIQRPLSKRFCSTWSRYWKCLGFFVRVWWCLARSGIFWKRLRSVTRGQPHMQNETAFSVLEKTWGFSFSKTNPFHHLNTYVSRYTYQWMVNVALLMDSDYMPLL